MGPVTPLLNFDTTATLVGEVHELRAENERLKGLVQRQNRRVGPYFIGQWTDEIVHVDPCDCELDEEEAGDRCMAASEWTYGVFVDGGAFAPRLITKLPRRPPEQSDDDTPTDWLAEVERLRQTVRDLEAINRMLSAGACGPVGDMEPF